MNIETQILSEVTTHLKYSKYVPEKNRRETWDELVTRNKNMHIKKFPQLTDEIEGAYKYVYDKKILPSMRSMQFAGKPIEINKEDIYISLYLILIYIFIMSLMNKNPLTEIFTDENKITNQINYYKYYIKHHYQKLLKCKDKEML